MENNQILEKGKNNQIVLLLFGVFILDDKKKEKKKKKIYTKNYTTSTFMFICPFYKHLMVHNQTVHFHHLKD